VRLEDVGEFVAWLRLPPAGRDGLVAVLPSAGHQVSGDGEPEAVGAERVYLHAVRHGVDLGELLGHLGPGGPAARWRGWKPFLHHVSKGQPTARRTIVLKASRKLPRILTVVEVQSILDACGRLRARFLFALLRETGIRIGEALGLRHADIKAAKREVMVFPRVDANGARCKSAAARTISVSAELVRLYGDYLHEEYGDLDSDYVFVNLWDQPRGHPLP
jgi:integrase/recombinase XerD